jgi:hypothetical protein
LRPVALPVRANLFKFILKKFDALANFTAVDFQLRFSRTPQANATDRTSAPAASASLASKMGPCAGQTRKPVFVLREGDLQNAFACVSVLRKNIQD